MMPHLVRAVLVTAICCVPQLSPAQEPASGTRTESPAWPVTFGWMFGGEGLCTSCNVGVRYGVEAGIEAQYQLPTRRLALRSDVMLHYVGEGGCTAGGGPGLGTNYCVGPQMPRDLWAWSADIVARLNDPATRWSPYVLGGGAVYSVPSTAAQRAATRAGVQWGFGFEVRPGKSSNLFLEWRHLDFSPMNLSPIVFGVRF